MLPDSQFSIMRLAAYSRPLLSSLSVTRQFHSSILSRAANGDRQKLQPEEAVVEDDVFDYMEPFDDDDMANVFKDLKPSQDSTAAGHLAMRQNRHVLHYLRLIETELPELVCA